MCNPKLILFLLLACSIGSGQQHDQILAQETSENTAANSDKLASDDPGFLNADANSNGLLSGPELQAVWIKNFDMYFRGLDSDQDGRISPVEYQRHREVLESVLEKKSAAPPKTAVAEFTDTYNKRFLDRKPRIGKTIDGLMAFGEDGKEFDFDALRGKFTVINFGCLT